MMSSPNHPTSDVEDAFSSNFPDYIPTSLDYFLALPGNISPDSSNDLTKFLSSEEISLPKNTKTPVESPIPISLSSSVGSSSPVRLTTSPPDYLFNDSIFAELDNSLWIIPQLLRSEPDPEEPNDAC
ncbi:hypothetical protein Tco_1488365 [Tanacetum coccineum]